MEHEVDAVVIGLGIGGLMIAHRLRDAGLTVIGIERRLIGGECHNWACLPTKMMVRAGNALAEASRVPELAGRSTVTSDWAPVAERISSEVTHDWNDAAAHEKLTSAGIRVLRGQATLDGPGRVRVGDDVIAVGRAVVIATGTEPAIPEIEGLDATPYWTNREVAELSAVPSSMIILGGGPVGCELAQVLRRFGVGVTLIESASRLLPSEDPESSAFVSDVLTTDGIDVRTQTHVTRVRHGTSGFTVTADDVTLTAERLLIASGRRMNLPDLGLDTIGIDPNTHALPVDDGLKVTDGVWAVGDVTGQGPFTHVATYQARIAAADILGEAHPAADYHAVPRCVFIDPEFSAVGLTADQARERGIRLRTGHAWIPTSARGYIHHVGNQGFITLYADADRDVLVGAVSAGPSGGEVLGLLTLAVQGEVPLDTLRYMIYAYPTFHRAVEDALTDMDSRS